MGQNLIERIAQRYAVDQERTIHSGDFVMIRPAHLLTHDNTSAVIPKFQAIGVAKIANPSQPVFALDHNIQDKGERNLEKYARIESFAKEHGIDFYPAGRGIGHQVMCEEGYAWPGTLVVASDSHANMYGALGCLGTPVTRSDAAAIWASGMTWWQVPPVARVTLTARLPVGVTGKDVIITLCGMFNQDQVLNHAIEFTGDGISSLSMDDRMTIANMSTEWGALAALFPVDAVTLDWLSQRARKSLGHPRFKNSRIDEIKHGSADGKRADASNYATLLSLDLSTVSPHVAGPNSVRLATPVEELAQKNIVIHKAYLISCVNSRVEDLAQAAEVLRGKKIHDGVKFYVSAASDEVQQESERRADWQALVDAGAQVLPPGCGPCIGLGAGTLESGEVGISATNRNFKGRMGSPDAQAYLASPAVVAASALAGKIAAPEGMIEASRGVAQAAETTKEAPKKTIDEKPGIVRGFPSRIEGGVAFCYQDNLNTDGIYPSKHTYCALTPEGQAAVVMENYDPTFREKAKKGDILVGGSNFGSGSSREQAATALKYFGIKLVVASSFSQTFRRNAFNNGFLTVVSPATVDAIRAKYGNDELTIRTESDMILNFEKWEIHYDGDCYPMEPLGEVVQQIIAADGIVGWISTREE